ncbi:MAG: T9SS type A sorting domain-containing protein [Bacteroidota bacterium]
MKKDFTSGILFLISFFLFVDCSAQSFNNKQGNTWYFGYKAGLDFNTVPPTLLYDGQSGTDTTNFWCPVFQETTTSISDSSGSLICYASGASIWNKNHQIIQNGDGLLGAQDAPCLLLPIPASKKMFCLVTLDDQNDTLRKGLRYNIIDMCLDSGRGAVVSGKKNLLLHGLMTLKLCATKHSNGNDYWILTHQWATDAFYAYHLSNSGITDSIVSHIGMVHDSDTYSSTFVGLAGGRMKFSPDGHKIALMVKGNYFELFDFNSSTGVVSNCIHDYDSIWITHGASSLEFSPNNQYLYISFGGSWRKIIQYDLFAGSGNPDSILQSKKILSTFPYLISGLQLAPDGKIYACNTNNNNTILGIINYPDLPDSFYNFVDSIIDFGTNHTTYGSLPNFISGFNYDNGLVDCSEQPHDFINENIEKNNFIIYPNPASSELTIISSQQSINTIAVFDLMGKTVASFGFGASGSLNLKSKIINLKSLSPGVYFIKLQLHDGSLEVRRFVKE